MELTKKTGNILCKLPEFIIKEIENLHDKKLDDLEEIRIKCGYNTILNFGEKEVVLKDKDLMSQEVVAEILNKILDYSYYAHEDELSNGYITIEGGHRVGICGKVTLKDGRVQLIKDISSINIRKSKEVIGCSDKVMSSILNDHRGYISNTLIISPPKCGKTTLIRDIARVLSNKGYRVSVCDERSEIAGCNNGKSKYDLGIRTDILDGCPKSQGIIMLIRAMSPDVIITDEIGKPEDIKAIEEALCCGVKVITTIHGNTYEDVISSAIGRIIERHFFETLIFLSNVPRTGTIKKIMQLGEIKKGD